MELTFLVFLSPPPLRLSLRHDARERLAAEAAVATARREANRIQSAGSGAGSKRGSSVGGGVYGVGVGGGGAHAVGGGGGGDGGKEVDGLDLDPSTADLDGFGSLSAEELEAVILAVDSNSDGRISLTEFANFVNNADDLLRAVMAVTSTLSQTPYGMPDLRTAFRCLAHVA